MLIKLRLPFSGPGISFTDFAPTKEDGALEVVLVGGDATALLYVTDQDRSRSVATPKNGRATYFERITVELSLADPEPEVFEALQSGQPNDSSRTYARKVFNTALGLHKILVAWWRTTFRFYELDDITYHDGEEQCLLCDWDAEWLMPDNRWAPFVAGKKLKVMSLATIHISIRGTMERSKWEDLGTQISRSKMPRMSDILITNAYQHLSQGDERVAVIEAVTALEAGLKQRLAPILKHAQQVRMAGKDHLIDKASTEAGLRLLTEVALPFAIPELEIEDCWIQALLPAIDLRNEIIHGPRRKVEPEKAKLAVDAVDALLDAMAMWHENVTASTDHPGS